VICCRSDGLGLKRLAAAGVDTLIISSEINPVVGVRAGKLGMDCLFGMGDKLAVLKRECRKRRISLSCAAYLGNDIN